MGGEEREDEEEEEEGEVSFLFAACKKALALCLKPGRDGGVAVVVLYMLWAREPMDE